MIGPNLSPKQRRRAQPSGPVEITAPSASPMVAREGIEVTRSRGRYAARAEGAVSITTSEWRLDGVQVATGASFTPDATHAGKILSYHEIATETGGDSPGTTTRQVVVGVVLPFLLPRAVTWNGAPVAWNGQPVIWTAAELSDALTWGREPLFWNGSPIAWSPAIPADAITWNEDQIAWNGEPISFNAA